MRNLAEQLQSQGTSASDERCAVCGPAEPWKRRTKTCCAEHREIREIAEKIRKGTATGEWEPAGPDQAKERWRNRAARTMQEEGYKRHWLHCIVAQGGKCGDPRKDPTGKGCGRSLLELPAGAVHVDHIVPRKQGGGSGWENCQALCTDCNVKSGDGSREDSPVREAQRIWEAAKSPEVVRQAREQGGRCTECRKWLWSKEPTTEWIIGKDRHLVCDQCGKVEQQKRLAEKKEIEKIRIETEIDDHIRKRKQMLQWTLGLFYATPLTVAAFLAAVVTDREFEIHGLWAFFIFLSIMAAMIYFGNRVEKKIVSRWRKREMQRRLYFNCSSDDETVHPVSEVANDLESVSPLMIDPPGIFAPTAEWQRFLKSMQSIPERTKQVDRYIAEAETVLAEREKDPETNGNKIVAR